jgi:hypothetical protein
MRIKWNLKNGEPTTKITNNSNCFSNLKLKPITPRQDPIMTPREQESPPAFMFSRTAET